VRFNAKPLILLIIILLAMPVLALLGFNLILQLPSVQNRIQSSIEKSVGMPISIGGISVTSCGDIKAQGVSSRGEGSPSFALESLVIHPFFLKGKSSFTASRSIIQFYAIRSLTVMRVAHFLKHRITQSVIRFSKPLRRSSQAPHSPRHLRLTIYLRFNHHSSQDFGNCLA